jgi:hypothetical protein
MLTSFHGFWFRPMTTHEALRYRKSSGFSGGLCLKSLWGRVRRGNASWREVDGPVLETEIEERVGGLGDEYGVLDVYSRTGNI